MIEQPERFSDLTAVRSALADVNYLADDGIAGVVYLADRLGKPVLVEGPAGTGKTQLAKSVAEIAGARGLKVRHIRARPARAGSAPARTQRKSRTR